MPPHTPWQGVRSKMNTPQFLLDFFLWDGLSKLRKNRLVQSSYVWLIIVPITAKLFSKMEEIFILNVGELKYVFDLELPFSWKLFYLAALFFTCGNIIFSIFSPKIFKENSDFGDFQKAGRDLGHIENYLEDPNDPHWKQNRRKAGTPLNERAEFWKVHHRRAKELPVVRYMSGAIYIVGLSLFFWVAVQNIRWVLGSWGF